MLRRTRFVCISDTHNASPDGSFKLPAGDVLIHAGDLTNQGKYTELRKTFDWISKADFEVKIAVAGNHDITLDQAFYHQYGAHHHGQHLQDDEACRNLLEEYPSITLLTHDVAEVNLLKPDGPRTSFKVFGSPYSPASGTWAYGYQPDEAFDLWSRIPLDADVVVTHTPPKYHCDESKDRGPTGCEALRQALWRVRPSLAVCGHVHEGRGVERVGWDLDSPNGSFQEEDVGYWVDPGAGNKKQCLVDLSSRNTQPLQSTNFAVEGKLPPQPADSGTEKPRSPPVRCWTWKSDNSLLQSEQCSLSSRDGMHRDKTTVLDAGIGVTHRPSCLLDEKQQPARLEGRDGISTSARSDREALRGRPGRKETFVVNAAMMATSWPHKAVHGNKYNKPIVVDIDLPTWETLD
ncbi:MAG: hypothetical protein L6R38_009172 [Xanthoria sp. 2 TBL-2021]|nr:MAG: hypothetical protein L6R38_009172 [Xanthoria sp. 2 TBL-2021]